MSLQRYQKAKTAYGLLSQIVRIIETDPRHMRMENWTTPVENLPENLRPVCGTVGCIGGWIDFLTERQGYKNAQKTLGFLRGPVFDLHGHMTPEFREEDQAMDGLMFGQLCSDKDQGSRQHARKVIRLIRKFQKTYRRRLLKTKVTIGGTAL